MFYIPQLSAPGKQNPDDDSELLIHALRTAAARTRLTTLKAVGVSLHQKSITVAEATDWLRQEELLDHVHFGLGGVR
jgi:hypothetical protein